MIDERFEETHVVVVLADGAPAARARVPIPAIALRVGHDHAPLVGDGVPARAGFDVFGITTRAVQHEHERHHPVDR